MVKQSRLKRILILMVLATCFSTFSGCGALAQLMWVIKGHDTPPDFAGLEEQKVAVICVSDASAYGPDTLTNTINRIVGLKLATRGKDIEVISDKKVQEWLDTNDWDYSDFRAIGKGLGATKVLSIEVGEYSIHEGQTIYKGRADITVNVHDIETGDLANVIGPNNYEFPEHGRPAIQTTERKFEAVYLAKLTEYIARHFYTHDHMDTVAEDAAMMR